MAEPKSKGLLALMVGKPAGKGESEDEPESGKAEAVKDFFTAGKSGDWEGAAAAFQRAYDMCGEYEDEEEDEEE